MASPVATAGLTMTYDALARRTSDGTRSRTYDGVGNVLRLDDGLNYIDMTYDALNRPLSSVTTPRFGTAPVVSLTYGYDALSRRGSMGDSLGGSTGYTYDAEDRVSTITTPWGGVIAQTYDTAGRPLRLAMPNGLNADVAFEAQSGRLASVTHRAGTLAVPVAAFGHSYDIRGNLAALAELTATRRYTYDAIERLTGVTAQASPSAAAAPAEAYTYDGEGNRTSVTIGAGPRLSVGTEFQNRTVDDGVNTYTWDGNNALASRAPKAPGGATVTFTNSWQAGYNQTRLERADYGGGASQFGYDPLNRLISFTQGQFSFGPNASDTTELRTYDGPSACPPPAERHGAPAAPPEFRREPPVGEIRPRPQ